MVRFQLFGIPISIEWMFWVVGVLFGYPFFKVPGRDGLVFALIWMVVWLISFVIHEMGHAWFYRKFGGRGTRIHLYGFGGYAAASGHFSRREKVIISSAGPAVEILVGLLVLLLLKQNVVPSGYGQVFCSLFSYICIFWGLFNLIPVYPLDGGHIVDAVHGKGMLVTAKIGVVAGVIAAVLLFTVFQIQIGAFFIAYLAFKNWQRTQFRG